MSKLKINGWVIEYWNPVSRNVSYFSSLDGNWFDAPNDNITYVWFFINPYIHVLQGTDYYFFNEEKFGGYQSPELSETTVNGPGRYYQIIDGAVVSTDTPDHTRPDFVLDEEIKYGVWVTEPCATKLSFTKESKGPRMAPELRKYVS